MWERIKSYLKERPWLTGILLAIPVVLIIWLIQRRKSTSSEDYQAAGMIYQPPSGGGSSGGSDSSMVTMLTDFLSGLSQREQAQSQQLQDFLKAQAESQKTFMEGISDVISQTKVQTTNIPAMMPEVPKIPEIQVKTTREVYYSPTSAFEIPSGQVRVTDMPGTTRDEQWKQFEQTIAYDYLGDIAREAQSKVTSLGSQWWSASPQDRGKIHQQAESERQRVYQEITRGGAGFSASWVDTGEGYKKLQVRTPKGETIEI